jgi:hypothetical protein
MAIPERAGGARPLIVSSVAMEVVSLLITVAVLINDLTKGFLDDQVRTVVNAGSVILSLISAVLFLLFCRSAAEFVRRPDLAAAAMSVLWLWVLTIVIYIVAVAISALGGRPVGRGGAGGGTCIGGILMIAVLITGIIALIRYANLLTGMADATLKYSRHAVYDFDDEEDDYDRPRRRARDDDYEDDDDDRPRRRRRARDDDDDDWER